jgi:hypothetical protein
MPATGPAPMSSRSVSTVLVRPCVSSSARYSASADCIQLYHGNALLAESLEVIQQTSGVILAALQPPAAAEAEMPDAELAKVA